MIYTVENEYTGVLYYEGNDYEEAKRLCDAIRNSYDDPFERASYKIYELRSDGLQYWIY